MNIEVGKAPKDRVLEVGARPSHKHRCGHLCNSPYCETPQDIDCQNCGGPPMVVQGYEPWRGR